MRTMMMPCFGSSRSKSSSSDGDDDDDNNKPSPSFLGGVFSCTGTSDSFLDNNFSVGDVESGGGTVTVDDYSHPYDESGIVRICENDGKQSASSSTWNSDSSPPPSPRLHSLRRKGSKFDFNERSSFKKSASKLKQRTLMSIKSIRSSISSMSTSLSTPKNNMSSHTPVTSGNGLMVMIATGNKKKAKSATITSHQCQKRTESSTNGEKHQHGESAVIIRCETTATSNNTISSPPVAATAAYGDGGLAIEKRRSFGSTKMRLPRGWKMKNLRRSSSKGSIHASRKIEYSDSSDGSTDSSIHDNNRGKFVVGTSKSSVNINKTGNDLDERKLIESLNLNKINEDGDSNNGGETSGSSTESDTSSGGSTSTSTGDDDDDYDSSTDEEGTHDYENDGLLDFLLINPLRYLKQTKHLSKGVKEEDRHDDPTARTRNRTIFIMRRRRTILMTDDVNTDTNIIGDHRRHHRVPRKRTRVHNVFRDLLFVDPIYDCVYGQGTNTIATKRRMTTMRRPMP